jgi:hypothetical protein
MSIVAIVSIAEGRIKILLILELILFKIACW